MKFNFTVDISGCHEAQEIEYEIINQAAKMLFQQVLGNWNQKDSYDAIKNYIVNKLESLNFDADFKQSVAKEVTKRLNEKYETTKQYKNIKNELEIESEQSMKKGLRNLIGEIVRSEVRKMIG